MDEGLGAGGRPGARQGGRGQRARSRASPPWLETAMAREELAASGTATQLREARERVDPVAGLRGRRIQRRGVLGRHQRRLAAAVAAPWEWRHGFLQGKRWGGEAEKRQGTGEEGRGRRAAGKRPEWRDAPTTMTCRRSGLVGNSGEVVAGPEELRRPVPQGLYGDKPSGSSPAQARARRRVASTG